MKTKKLDLTRLHNEEHSQFGADVIALVKAATPTALQSRQFSKPSLSAAKPAAPEE